jgi:hypothetical protein
MTRLHLIYYFPETQIEALREAGHGIGDGFVTLAVNTTASGGAGAQHSVEAFQVRTRCSRGGLALYLLIHAPIHIPQVSQQAVQMLWDGLIDEAKATARPTQTVPTTR